MRRRRIIKGKKLFVALAALAAVALLTLAQFGEGLLAVLLVIVCLVLLGLLTLHGGRRTAFGDEIVTQAMSYRRFLRRVTQSQLLSRLAQDSQYFYRILPYAEAIGLGAGLARTLGNTGARAVRLVSGAAAPAAHGRRVLQSPAGGAGPAGAFDPEIKRTRLPQQRQARFHAITAPYAGSSGRIRRTARLSPPYTA